MAYANRKNCEVTTWISLHNDCEEIHKKNPESSKSAFFIEEFDVSSSSEKSSPEISKHDPGSTAAQNSRMKIGPAQMDDKLAQAPKAKKKRGRPPKSSSNKKQEKPSLINQNKILPARKYDLRPVTKVNWLTRKTTKRDEPNAPTLATVKRPRGRSRVKRTIITERRTGHCACCTCTRSESPSPVRIHPMKFKGKKEPSDNEVERREFDSDEEQNLDIKTALLRVKKEPRISEQDVNDVLPDQKVQLIENIDDGIHDSSQCSTPVTSSASRKFLTKIESPDSEDSFDSVASHGYESHSGSLILPSRAPFPNKKKAGVALRAISIYDYKGPLIVLCKDDLGEETPKDFCLFCANLHQNIRQHMIEKHCDQEQVAFVTSRGSKLKQRFWKLLSAMGNHVHNNVIALRAGTGFIIPSAINSTRKYIYDMRMCSGCKTWVITGSLYTHKKICAAEQWERNLGGYLERRFQNGSSNATDNQSKVQIVLASLYESASELLLGDILCMKYLANISNAPNTTHKDVWSCATALANLILVMKKRYPRASNIRAVFDLDRIKMLMTSIRVVATDKVTMKLDMEQVLQLSTMVGELMVIAQEMSEDEEAVEYLEELKGLLKSERWLQTLTKPIK